MSRTRCYTFECRTCAERIVLPYRNLQFDGETQYYWPADEPAFNFVCTESRVVTAYAITDLRWEPQFALSPVPLGSTLWKVRLLCDHEECRSVFSVHVKDRKGSPRVSPVRLVLDASGPLQCSQGHVNTNRLALRPELIAGDLNFRSPKHSLSLECNRVSHPDVVGT
jgi:hypothetical protein